MIKTGDKLYCYRYYIKKYGSVYHQCIFTEGKFYTVGKIDLKNNIIGIVISDDGIAEFNMYYENTYLIKESTHKDYFLTMAEYRDKQINEILDI